MITGGVHHVSVNVADTATAVDFYVGVLGLEQLPRPELAVRGAWLRAGDQEIHLIEQTVPTDHGQHFALRVADIDDAVVELRLRGVEVPDPSEIAGVCRQTFLHDPFGNRIELNQPS